MSRAILIGCGGGSASGKSTFARQLARTLAPLKVQVINQDHFYKRGGRGPRYFSAWDRRRHPDYNHPEAFRWPALRRACRNVRERDVVILEGIMALYDRRVRDPRLRGGRASGNPHGTIPTPTRVGRRTKASKKMGQVVR